MQYFAEEDVYERVIEEANYILKHGATVRETARVFNMAKTTLHKDVTERLRTYNFELAMKVANVLAKNKAERHLRGGNATKIKYKKLALQMKRKGEQAKS